MVDLSSHLDQRLANLGQLQDEHAYTENYHRSMLILALAFIVFSIPGMAVSIAFVTLNNSWWESLLFFLISLPFLVGGLWLYQKAWHDKKLRFLVYEHGLVYHTHDRTDVVRWDEVKELLLEYEKHTSPSNYGMARVVESFYRLSGECITNQGTALKFKNLGGDIERFGELIDRINSEIVSQRKVPNYKAILARGEGVEFRELTVTTTGFIAKNKQSINWEEIDAVYFTPQSFSIIQKGWEGKCWQSFPLKKLPNAFAIPILISPYIEVNGGDDVIGHSNKEGLMRKPSKPQDHPGKRAGGEHPDEAMSSKRWSTAFLP
jgi:hypothetical protein